jgi:hypothetical protein
VQQLGQQEPRRTATDNANLSFHIESPLILTWVN